MHSSRRYRSRLQFQQDQPLQQGSTLPHTDIENTSGALDWIEYTSLHTYTQRNTVFQA